MLENGGQEILCRRSQSHSKVEVLIMVANNQAQVISLDENWIKFELEQYDHSSEPHIHRKIFSEHKSSE